jgi:hypothetical protein
MAVAAVIGDDHVGDRALTPFFQMIAIHGLTIIAHHCSILITMGLQGNASRPLRPSAAAPDCCAENQENQ